MKIEALFAVCCVDNFFPLAHISFDHRIISVRDDRVDGDDDDGDDNDDEFKIYNDDDDTYYDDDVYELAVLFSKNFF